MATTKIGRRGTVVIPAKLRKPLGLDEGDLMVAAVVDGGILLRPAAVVPGKEKVWAQALLRATNEAYVEPRKDPEAWAEYLDEIKEFDGTLMDGLDPDEVWGADGPEK